MIDMVQRRGFGRPPAPENEGGRLTPVLDAVSRTHTRAIAFLVACGFLFFLPGLFNIGPIDRDEARFAQASKQMVETGDLVDIRFQDEVRYKKPVGIYWLQSAAVQTASKLGLPNSQIRIWLYRVPSLFGAIGAVLLTYWTALAFVTRRGAVLAGLAMCSSVLLGIEARLATTDAVLLLTTTAVMGALARVYLSWQRGEAFVRGAWAMPAIFWTAVAASVLVKGPLIFLIVGLTIVTLGVFDRSVQWLRRLRPVPGLIWMLILIVPWFVAIYLKSGGSFFTNSVGGDMLSKVAAAQESHGAPPGLYFILFWVTFWPASTLAGVAAPAVWRARREPGAQFLLAWLVPTWIVFELIITKLPHYVLPLYPAIAILIVGALQSHALSRWSWIVRGAAWWFVFPAIVAVGAIVLSISVLKQPVFAAWPFGAAAMVFGLFAWWMYDDANAERSVLNGALASLALSACVFGIVLPALTPLFPSVQIARALRNVECKGPLAAAAGYQEPSLVFMVGTQTLLTNGSGAADFLQQGSCRFALVESRDERAFAQRAEAIGLRYSIVKRIEGYNISQGRDVSIAVFTSEWDH
ncbi:glycosyl transferase [Afipia carboxidovorans OM5]|uniref:Glycosyl transferase n=1 Tax=Afipia carboxidovorans (strain ATCC 49405 / DSM 1227 / KCTC 32145 / OM5) TaxID=504832 RepID=F8BVI0_AFIC5|nr:glycosyltransferase family 39 protein [Afipia carboxidovorans]AEI03108.1 glycosyl transferase [Afipia carboxidovorans OM4]AEI06685.1 glycosyl transferase [Afipia carboxidovorans OM5]